MESPVQMQIAGESSSSTMMNGGTMLVQFMTSDGTVVEAPVDFSGINHILSSSRDLVAHLLGNTYSAALTAVEQIGSQTAFSITHATGDGGSSLDFQTSIDPNGPAYISGGVSLTPDITNNIPEPGTGDLFFVGLALIFATAGRRAFQAIGSQKN